MEENRAQLTSILFPAAGPAGTDAASMELARTQPDCFPDLALDLVIERLVGTDDYELRPFYWTPLTTLEQVEFRHAVLADLAHERVQQSGRAFAEGMRELRTQLALVDKLRYVLQRQRVFLDAVTHYVTLTGNLARGLMDAPLESAGMLVFQDHLDRYVASEGFTRLAEDAERVAEQLDEVEYEFLIDGNSVTVIPYGGETDFSADVVATFAKFRQSDVGTHRTKFIDTVDMNHVEAGILGLVADVFPEPFAALAEFCNEHATFQSATLARFDRELQFYFTYQDYLAHASGNRLPVCVPRVVDERESNVTGGYDLALAFKRQTDATPLVTNDFQLRRGEQFLVVTGANQGGKTTFARSFGQLHYLAALGLPVPARRAVLPLFDRLYTHFERQEDLTNLAGKLEDDLVRAHAIISSADDRSIVIMNETFTSTTAQDALELGERILRTLIDEGAMGVYVTFIDELTALGPETVSMVAEVDPDDVTRRTFHIERRAADGLAHATALADRYGLSTARITERIAS